MGQMSLCGLLRCGVQGGGTWPPVLCSPVRPLEGSLLSPLRAVCFLSFEGTWQLEDAWWTLLVHAPPAGGFSVMGNQNGYWVT